MSKEAEEVSFYQVDSHTSLEFDSRYSKGYMTAPRVVERKRISEVLKKIAQLSDKGVALDFGCGKGDFTILLKQLLPGWRVVGLDISAVAIQKARELYPQLEFHLLNEFQPDNLKFDLIFSHHVLEYVPDLDYVLSKFESWSSKNAIMLHVIPCGNYAGLEYRIASLVNGVNTENGLYFFEHTAHKKRYSDNEFIQAATANGFAHRGSWFVDQYWGAVEWITRSNRTFLNFITPLHKAISTGAFLRILLTRLFFYFLFMARYSYFNFNRARRKASWNVGRKILFLGVACMYIPSMFFNYLLLFVVDIEWKLSNQSRGGGKMYLFFTRG
ncbi:MAG TPA: class I SAM-dependent methyltransferase [Cyclobacteriaceae bacterium]|nr:class I SAM-dependent methyltransferase [Cyclobacteriaceae bacterium]HRJ83298.1 class I SAM-dependent methyltransferase [Cyclobacteriaceae bacterium]